MVMAAGLRVSSRQNGLLSGGERAYSPLQTPAAAVAVATTGDAESWGVAETTTRDVLFRVWPTLVADKKRHDIIEYIQSLVRYYTGCEIFPYGSVPLKTYLPDGDIDLTAISPDKADSALARDVYALLRREENDQAARFKIKDVQRIDAEVKLVKCIVEDIVVDISFNQLGGLSALCFLEQIDRLTGNDHLFKRSIILIKAWCYYESRILGAHHGLISTYALEILVLHIFDVFHSSLEGPLSVLYTFLVYFSGFDWENYCISLRGPVRKSSQHDVVAEVPVNETYDRLLSEEFLKSCREKFSVSSSNGLETKLQPFPLKYLNIIDPLKENNNLGRSVCRGSFCRIRSAFKYGANKLGRILSLPVERIMNELYKFFANTLDRNKSNCWSIVPNSTQTHGLKVSESFTSPSSSSETFSEWDDVVDTVGSFKLEGPEISYAFGKKPDTQSPQDISSQLMLQLRCHLSEDAAKLLASGVTSISQSHTRWYENRNEKTDNWGFFGQKLADYSTVNDETKEKHAVPEEITAFIDSIPPISDVSNVSKIIDKLEALTLLLDLGGNYDSHFRNLRCGQLCLVYATSPTLFPVFLPLQHNNIPWIPSHHQPTQFYQGVGQSCSRNGFGLGPQFHQTKDFGLSCAAFGEENRKSRGTGTYLPNSNFRQYSDRRSAGRRRTMDVRSCGQFPIHDRSDNWNVGPDEFSASPEWQCELPQTEYFSLGNWESGSSDHYQVNYPSESWDTFRENVCSLPPKKIAEEVSLPSCLPATPLPETDPGTLPFQGSASSPNKCKPSVTADVERVKEQAYHLKDECDFPPLNA